MSELFADIVTAEPSAPLIELTPHLLRDEATIFLNWRAPIQSHRFLVSPMEKRLELISSTNSGPTLLRRGMPMRWGMWQTV